MGLAKGGRAHLDSDGIITALGDGSTYIFARRGSVAAATVLTVGSPTTYTEYSTSAYGVDAYPDAVTILAAGGERQIVTRLDPFDEVYADGPDSGTIYIWGDSSIVTVDENGLIRRVGEGVTTITVIQGFEIGRAHVCTPATNAKFVSCILPETQK